MIGSESSGYPPTNRSKNGHMQRRDDAHRGKGRRDKVEPQRCIGIGKLEAKDNEKEEVDG